jgi:hypothetical protein
LERHVIEPEARASALLDRADAQLRGNFINPEKGSDKGSSNT